MLAVRDPGGMTIRVELAELAEVVARRAAVAYLVSIGDDGPRVVSVAPEVRADGTVAVGAGRHTTANARVRPAVTLLWPADEDDPDHSLLVDGTVDEPAADAEHLVIRPSSAMLHRIRRGRGRPEPC